MKENEIIPFTCPFVPETEELSPYLDRIRGSRILTNRGPLHEQLEQELAAYLGVKYLSLFTNGTLALMVALKSSDLHGEVITTPFTWIATAQSILWNNLTPVFADIRSADLNIDPASVERLITPQTSAIMPVHVFGNPCRIDEIEELASGYYLKIIYDAAHAFGVKLSGIPVLNFGNLAVISFHATKVFHCFEGGAVVSHDLHTKNKIDALRNHGFANDHHVEDFGLNGKMNEFQAACGLIHLKYVDQFIQQRKSAVSKYRNLTDKISGIDVIHEKPDVHQNNAYFPVMIDPEVFGATRDELMQHLKNSGIITRAYFSPLVTHFEPFSHCTSASLHHATKASERILCLPLFAGITHEQINRIMESIAGFGKKQIKHKTALAR